MLRTILCLFEASTNEANYVEYNSKFIRFESIKFSAFSFQTETFSLFLSIYLLNVELYDDRLTFGCLKNVFQCLPVYILPFQVELSTLSQV